MIKSIDIDDLLDNRFCTKRKSDRLVFAQVALSCIESNMPFVCENKHGELQTVFIPSKGVVMHRNKVMNCDHVNLSISDFANHVKLALVGGKIRPLSIGEFIRFMLDNNSLDYIQNNSLQIAQVLKLAYN